MCTSCLCQVANRQPVATVGGGSDEIICCMSVTSKGSKLKMVFCFSFFDASPLSRVPREVERVHHTVIEVNP